MLDVNAATAVRAAQGPAADVDPKPSDWGAETAARLQAEAICLWPGKNPTAPSHRAEVRNWTWTRNAYA